MNNLSKRLSFTAIAILGLASNVLADSLPSWSVSLGGLNSGSTLDGIANSNWQTIHAPSTAPGAAISVGGILDDLASDPIGFTITGGTVSEFGGRFAWETAGNPIDLYFEITGLTPGATYSLYSYGAGFGTRNFNLQVDQSGNGSLDSPVVSVYSTTTGSQINNIVADSFGDIIGLAAGNGSDEADWTAFQLVQTSAGPTSTPEPAAMGLTCLGAAILMVARKYRQQRS